MADTTLKTRIQLKYDTLANWNASDLVLKAGEVAIATVPTGGTAAAGTAGHLPQILIKVGDGVNKFRDLNFIQAKAADVYAWAKAETLAYEALPEELRTEVANLKTAVGTGGSVATAIQNAINALDKADAAVDHEFVTAVSETDGIITVARKALVKGDIPTIDQAQVNGLPAVVDKVETLETDLDNAETAITTLQGKVDVTKVSEAIATAKDEAITAAAADATTKANAAQAAAAVDATDKADTAEANAIAAAALDATDKADAAQAAAEAYADGLAGNYATKAYEAKVDALVGDDIDSETNLPKTVRAIAAEELAAQLIPETADEALDTLQEIAAWIQAHPDDASAMAADIQNNATAIAAETTRATGVEGGLNTRLTTAEANIDAAEGNINTINGKLTGIGGENQPATVVAAITAETNRATTAEGNLNTAITNEVTAREQAIGTNNTGLLGDDVYGVIKAEKDRAMSAEDGLDDRIDDVIGDESDNAGDLTLNGLKNAITGNTTAINANANDIDDLQTNLGNLETAAIKTITPTNGLTVNGDNEEAGVADNNNNVTIGIDTNWTFILNCGNATTE